MKIKYCRQKLILTALSFIFLLAPARAKELFAAMLDKLWDKYELNKL